MEKSSENGSLHEIRTQRKCLRLQYTVCFDLPRIDRRDSMSFELSRIQICKEWPGGRFKLSRVRVTKGKIVQAIDRDSTVGHWGFMTLKTERRPDNLWKYSFIKTNVQVSWIIDASWHSCGMYYYIQKYHPFFSKDCHFGRPQFAFITDLLNDLNNDLGM